MLILIESKVHIENIYLDGHDGWTQVIWKICHVQGNETCLRLTRLYGKEPSYKMAVVDVDNLQLFCIQDIIGK